MITDVTEIKQIEKDLENYYRGLRTEQRTDETYYNDEFATPLIQQPYHVVRTRRATRLVETPAEHIITSNPQVFVEGRNNTQIARDTATKQAKLFNHWVSRLKLNNPDPIKEFVKNLLLRGEAYFQVLFNEGWDKENDNDLPVWFLTPDPMLVMAYPEEDYGIPKAVIVKYKRLSWIVKEKWPDWAGSGKKEIDWLEYWDKDVRYFEADGKPVLKDEIQKNIYGFVPCVHAYSGLGKSSPDGKPESLAVSILRNARPLLLEECQLRSMIDSIVHLYTHPTIDLLPQDIQAEARLNQFQYKLTPGEINPIPYGIKVEKDRGTPPSAELFTHLQDVEYRLDLLMPKVMAGIATSSRSSGRLEDLLYSYTTFKYDTIVENTEKALGRAIDLGRRIMVKIPKMLPVTITASIIKDGKKVPEEQTIKKEDLLEEHRITAQLQAADPVEEDRRALLFRTYYTDGIIDWKTCLVEGLGKTPSEAEDIINQTIADKALLQTGSPLLGLIVKRAFENLGMQDELEALKTDQAQQQRMATALQQQATQTGTPQMGEPRTLNLDWNNPQVLSMADELLRQRAQRRPPGR